MARNVGSIEVTVDADTGKLKAKLVKDATSAGREAARALERELRDIDAELQLNSTAARADLRKFKEASERLGIEMEVGLSDESKAELRAELAALDEQIDSLDAQVGVELDPGARKNLEAQLKELQASASEFNQIKMQASLAGRTALDAALKQIESEQHKIQLQLDADPKQIEAQLAELNARKEAIEFQLRIDDKSKAILDTQLRRIEIEDRTIELTATLDEKKVLAELQALQAKKIELGADTTQAEAEYRLWAERLEANKLAATITGDFTDFNLAVREMRAKLALEKFEIKVEPEIDSTALARKRAELGIEGEKAGGVFGKGFGQGGANILPGQITEWLPLIGLALEPLGPLVEGIAGGAVQVMGSAFSALGGAAGAAAPLVAGLAASLGAVVVASLGVGKGISAVRKEYAAAADEGRAFNINAKDIQKAMGALGPAAQDVVIQFAKLFPQLQAFQNIIAEQVFAGLGTEMARLSKETIPDLATSLSLAGQSANTFFRGLSTALQGVDFTGTFMAIKPALDSLGRAVVSVVKGIEPFLKAAAPAARELATWIEHGAASLLKMVQQGAASGKITQFLMEGIDSLKQWVSLVGAVGKALFTLFQAGKSGGDGMVASLTNIVNKWNDWMRSVKGQDALAKFFANSREILSDLSPLLVGLARGLQAIFEAGSGSGFKNLAADLGRVVEVAGELLGILSRANITGAFVQLLRAIADALEPIIPDLQEAATAIGGALSSAIVHVTPAIQTMATVIDLLARAFSALPDGIQEIVVVLGALGIAAGKIGFDKISAGFKGLQENIILLKPALQDVGSAFSTLFTGLKTQDLTKVSTGFSQLGPAIVQAGKSGLAAAGTALAAGLGVAFGLEMISQGHDMVSKVEGIGTVLASTLTAFFAGGGGLTGGALAGVTLAIGLITSEIKKNADAARVAKQDIKDWVSTFAEIGPQARRAEAAKAVMDDIKEAGDGTRDVFQKLGFSVGDWARATVSGTDSASAAGARLAAKFGPVGKQIAEGLKDGTITLTALGLSVAGVSDAVDGVDIGAFKNEIKGAGLDVKDTAGAFAFLGKESHDMGLATVEAGRQTFEAGHDAKDGSDAAAEGLDGWSAASEESSAASIAATEALAAFEQQMSNVAGTSKAASDGFSSITDAVFGIAGPMSTTEAAMAGVGKAAADAAKQADAMGKAIDTLISPALDAEGALSDYQAAVDDLSASLKENGKSLDIGTEKGRANREQIRTNIESILAYGEAAIKSGDDQGHVTQSMEDMRSELVKQVAAFTGSTESAEAYVNQLGLTPESISTIVNTPGLLEASKSILDYDFDMDGIADSVDTEFSATNLEAIKAKLAEYGIDLSKVPPDVLTEFLQKNWDQVHQQAVDMKGAADAVTNTPATVTMGVAGADTTNAQVDNVFQKIGSLNTLTGTGTVAVKGADTSTAQVDGTSQAVSNLDKQSADPSVSIANNAIVVVQLAYIQAQLAALHKSHADPQITLPTYGLVVAEIFTVMQLIVALGRAHADPQVTIQGYGTAIGQIAAVGFALSGLNGMHAHPSVTVDGVDHAIQQVGALASAINNLHDRSVTVTTNNVTTGTPGGMTGAMITQPMTMNVGELGLREALIPLDLPLGQVDPSVRGMAAMVRGQGASAGSTIERQVNVYNTIEVLPSSADPGQIAQQVVNRAAAMAN